MKNLDDKLERRIRHLEYESLSGQEVLELCQGKTNIMTYPELVKYDNIDDILGKYGSCVILYMTSKNYGHYTCVFKENNKTIQHFDSYGLKPDKEFNFISTHFRKVNNEWLPHLTYLLYNSGYKITYNEYRLQHDKVATCGRWVSARILLKHLPLKTFVNLFKKYKEYDSDFIVTLFTYLI